MYLVFPNWFRTCKQRSESVGLGACGLRLHGSRSSCRHWTNGADPGKANRALRPDLVFKPLILNLSAWPTLPDWHPSSQPIIGWLDLYRNMSYPEETAMCNKFWQVVATSMKNMNLSTITNTTENTTYLKPPTKWVLTKHHSSPWPSHQDEGRPTSPRAATDALPLADPPNAPPEALPQRWARRGPPDRRQRHCQHHLAGPTNLWAY